MEGRHLVVRGGALMGDGDTQASGGQGALPLGRGGEAGFTLVEVLVALAVLAVLGLGVYGLIHAAANISQVTEGVTEAQEGARFGLDRISEEARWAITVVEGSEQSVCLKMAKPSPYEPDYYEVTFRREGPAVVRVVGDDEAALSANVQDFRLTYYAADGSVLPLGADGFVDARKVCGLGFQVTAVSKGRTVSYGKVAWLRNVSPQ